MSKNLKRKKLRGKKKCKNSNSNVCRKDNEEFDEKEGKPDNVKHGVSSHRDEHRQGLQKGENETKCPDREKDSPKLNNEERDEREKREEEKIIHKGGSINTLTVSGEKAERIKDTTDGSNINKLVNRMANENEDKKDVETTVPTLKDTTKIGKRENKCKLNEDDMCHLLTLGKEGDIEENIDKLFPRIDFYPMSYWNMRKEEEEDEFLGDISKEIEKLQTNFSHMYFLQNVKNSSNMSNHYYDRIKGWKHDNKQNEKKTKGVNENCSEIKKGLFLNGESQHISDIINKGHTFLNLKRRNKKKKKKKKIKMRTKNYKVLNDLCMMNEEKVKKKKKYFIFNYSCGNTKIQSIMGNIRCFRSYRFYKEWRKLNKGNHLGSVPNGGYPVRGEKTEEHPLRGEESEKHSMRGEESEERFLRKNENAARLIPDKWDISVLLCVNVFNCLSPSEFLELLYPFDNFVFFLKVLNKKNCEEYMIYCLTFDIYAKKILRKAKRISFFNMKKKKKLKIYLVKDITMDVTSCIDRKDKHLRGTRVFCSEEGKKGGYCVEKRKIRRSRRNGRNSRSGIIVHRLAKAKFINALYLVSQNKPQLSCAVCLEPLYSESLSEIVSHIFNQNLEKEDKKTKTPVRNDDSAVAEDGAKFDGAMQESQKNTPVKNIREKREGAVAKGNSTTAVATSVATSAATSAATASITCKDHFCEDGTSSEKLKTKEDESVETKWRDYHVHTLSNLDPIEYKYYVAAMSFMTSMQSKYNFQVKRRKYKKNKLFNNVCINILCSHIFHSNCLKKCCFTSCPICRYKQYNYQIANCDICEKNCNAKICLFCGFIGCSLNYDRITKLKEKKLEKKKKYLKKKKIIIKKIIYLFMRIINIFFKKKSYTIQYFYYESKHLGSIYDDKYISEEKKEICILSKSSLSKEKNEINETEDVSSYLGSTHIDQANEHTLTSNFRKAPSYIYISKGKTGGKRVSYCFLRSVVTLIRGSDHCVLGAVNVHEDIPTEEGSISEGHFHKRKGRRKPVDHAKSHFYETRHNYFFDIAKNSVYDYSSYIYIKKLINLKNENKSLKKMYTGNIYQNGKNDIVNKKNIVMYIYEFNQLLSALLESQRDSFLSCIHDLKLSYEDIRKENYDEVENIFSELKFLQKKNDNLKIEWKRKIITLQEKIKTNTDLSQQLKHVEIINEKLCEQQRREIHNHELEVVERKNAIRERQQTIRELNQQITDLSFHKQASAKFSQNAEMANSSFMIGEKITNKSRFKKR
ncbi:conserved Plasmodium protein, unknown function [Plasmodium ovale]|uniref:Zinc finger protein n=2 Tax=Plasmodium ovale TaxID=36330 RepID=A0A1D3U8K1_PLAOA|nr:conserved Plasmodium protein, unknown function [Plasmodium ovale]